MFGVRGVHGERSVLGSEQDERGGNPFGSGIPAEEYRNKLTVAAAEAVDCITLCRASWSTLETILLEWNRGECSDCTSWSAISFSDTI